MQRTWQMSLSAVSAPPANTPALETGWEGGGGKVETRRRWEKGARNRDKSMRRKPGGEPPPGRGETSEAADRCWTSRRRRRPGGGSLHSPVRSRVGRPASACPPAWCWRRGASLATRPPTSWRPARDARARSAPLPPAMPREPPSRLLRAPLAKTRHGPN